MTSNLKSFFSQNRLTLAIAFVLIGTLFVHPFTVYSVDSDYLWHKNYWYAPWSAWIGVKFYTEPIENTEFVFFSEDGRLRINRGGAPDVTGGELRVTADELKPEGSVRPDEVCWFIGSAYDISYQNAFWYCDYIGVIVKKDGKIVSASLYKMYSIDAHWTGYVEEVAILEFPFLNEFVTETYVKSELRRIEAIDRVLTHNNLLTRLFAPPSISDEAWEDWRPPHSPTYNP